ncbi:hypothetical protein [Deinococcus ficus]|uniref:hypothetical protein n=1 Tax=Deinococcus ficus TaxID=317577 RepID=UPI00041F0350|nr:hypothetical protein [Deinococcus ficus]
MIQNLPDEVFHLFVEKCFHILSKQVGMSATGYDFSTEEQKKVNEFLTKGLDDVGDTA